jgi:hypothetical protein
MHRVLFILSILFFHLLTLKAQNEEGKRFEQLGSLLASPNEYRTASGMPGEKYWQQKADYFISVEINEENHTLTGSAKIIYTNNSPHDLHYLWMQLDQNVYKHGSDFLEAETGGLNEVTALSKLAPILDQPSEYGYTIEKVSDKNNQNLPHFINNTMMRIDLKETLKAGKKTEIKINWKFKIVDREEFDTRNGKEFFKEDGNYLYTIAQWFPRMCVYSDFGGWQNKQYYHQAEFSLPFGDYEVKITVPSDFMVAATGTLQNGKEVLSKEEQIRFEEAKKSFDTPVIIRTQKEVEQLEKSRSKDKKTWVYKAEAVRDFAFAASRKLIWDAMAVKIGNKDIMAMSYYCKEANPLYEKFSTKAVAHTLKVYSRYTIDYPYPVAIAVESNNAIEYPMICFTYGRPKKDGTYTDTNKYRMISVIIHEVGHNFFPMIINSDERHWTWQDEGFNSFVQYLAEQEWEPNYPSRRGTTKSIIPHMKAPKNSQQPMMTGAENIVKLSYLGYYKPSTALNVLRQTVMGPELFDYAFKEYATRWKFKHPTPEDFFRTMEDASAVDLDWFWRGWFYSTDHVDISIDSVKLYQYGGEKFPLKENIVNLSDEKRKALLEGKFLYEIKFRNLGGIVMPLNIKFTYEDGTTEVQRIPAEVWRRNDSMITKVFGKSKEVVKIELDPGKETADVEEANNIWNKSSQ